jgi:multiubiquitin
MTGDNQQQEQEAEQHKTIRIIVNGEPKTVTSQVVSYTEAVNLAYPTPPAPNTTFTVTFRNAVEPREGSLVEGQSVKVREEGTIFNVRATGKS